MNYILLLITVPLTLFAVAFAVSNPADATFALADWTVRAPLGAAGLSLMGAGFFFGALFVWLHGQSVRLKCWRETRRADRLEKELAAAGARERPAA